MALRQLQPRSVFAQYRPFTEGWANRKINPQGGRQTVRAACLRLSRIISSGAALAKTSCYPRFAQRNKGAAFLGNQHASHPINAMLNYCYIVEAGRLAKALAAQGLCRSIGFLHSDKKGRNSLVWDAIEPLRPAIDAKVFAFVEAHEFARRDFPQSGYNVHRLSRDVTQLLLHSASLPARDIDDAADWMVRTIRWFGKAKC